MLGALPFTVCLVLHYYFHISLPWYVWVFSMFLTFSDHAVKLKKA